MLAQLFILASYLFLKSLTEETFICICVPKYKCNDKGLINSNESYYQLLVENHNFDNSNCVSDHNCCTIRKSIGGSNCNDNDGVCCLLPLPSAPIEEEEGSDSIPNKEDKSLPLLFTDEDEEVGDDGLLDIIGDNEPIPAENFQCGNRYSPLTDKISGDSDDTETSEAEFPWMLLLIISSNHSEEKEIRGASLITPSLAITAAHCVFGKTEDSIIVRAGEWDLSTTEENVQHQERKVSTIKIHPKFNLSPLDYDLALLALNSPFIYSTAVNTICVPPPQSAVSPVTCFATGWGSSSFGSDGITNILRKARVHHITNEKCRELLPKQLANDINERFRCTKNSPNQGICKGDGGGPLVCQTRSSSHEWFILGVVSWAVDQCSNKDSPTVYTDTMFLSEWIYKNIVQLSNGIGYINNGTTPPPVLPISAAPSTGTISKQENLESNDRKNVYPSNPYNNINNGEEITEMPNYNEGEVPNDVQPIVVPEGTVGFQCGERKSPITVKADYEYLGEVERGEFPWMLALKYYQKYICGASLISPSVAITSAHCIQWKETDKMVVQGGELRSTKNNTSQERQIVQIVSHPEYDDFANRNDLAILALNKPFSRSININTICAPPSEEDLDLEYCYTTGWGATENSVIKSDRLRKIRVSVINGKKCEDQLQIKLGPTFKLHQSFLCAAGTDGQNTCKGDGGGPLACQIRGKNESYYLIGVTSWGISGGCNRVLIPGVYADVQRASDWIKQTISTLTLLNVIPEQ